MLPLKLALSLIEFMDSLLKHWVKSQGTWYYLCSPAEYSGKPICISACFCLLLVELCWVLKTVMFKTDLTLTLLLKTDLTLTILLIQQHAAHTVQAQMLTGASKPIGTQLFKNESMPCVCECPMFLSFSHSWSRKTGYKTLIRVCVCCLLIPSCAFAFRPSLAQT